MGPAQRTLAPREKRFRFNFRLAAIPITLLPVVLTTDMRYVGEYVIPIAALILLVVVWYWDDVRLLGALVKRITRRVRLLWNSE